MVMELKNKYVKSILLISILLFFLTSLIPVQSLPPFFIDGETVYIENNRVYLAVTPHTTTGGWIYLNFTSKVYAGEIDLSFGFNSTTMKPRICQVYNPTSTQVLRTYDIPSEYFDGNHNDTHRYNVTWGNADPNWLYDGNLILEQKYPEGWGICFNEDYEQLNRNNYKVYYYTSHLTDWQTISTNQYDWTTRVYEYETANLWHSIRHNILLNKEYYLRIWVDVIPSETTEFNKYWVAVKPADLTYKQAYKQDKLLMLDPWFNSSWAYCQGFTFNYADYSGTDYPIPLYFEWGNGTSSGDTFYLNEHCQIDFDDIRFTADDNSTLWDYWIEESTDSDDGFLWLKVGDDLTSTNVTGYLWYGNLGATPYSNGENTFLLFSDFSSNDGWTLQNGGTISGGALDCYNWGSWSGAYQSHHGEDNYIYRFRFNTTATNNGWRAYSRVTTTHSDNKPQMVIRDYASNPVASIKYETSGGNTGSLSETRDSNYHILSIYRSDPWYNVTWDDGSPVGLNNGTNETGTNLGFSTEPYINQHVYIDWVFSGKYIDPSPNINTWTEEESYVAPTGNGGEEETSIIEEFMLGSGGWLGLVITLCLILIVTVINRYAGIIFIPICVFIGIFYLDNLATDSNLIWGAITMFLTPVFLMFQMAVRKD